MADETQDWRLRGQERYLQGRAWLRRRYVQPRDHCEFCWAKFMETAAADILDEGYATENESHWVCPPCFEDFRERFSSTVRGIIPTP